MRKNENTDMKHTTFALLALAWASVNASAQPSTDQPISAAALSLTTLDRNLFNHMDLGLTLGSTGFGLDLSMPAGEYVRVRTGFTLMPHFNKNMHFGVQVGEDDPNKTAEENQRIQNNRFERLASTLEGLTGYAAKNNICMKGSPRFHNFKLLADVYPFKNNKHWHFTAGFYVGRSRIGKAVNAQEDMPSLMAVNIYNGIYWNVYNEQDIITYNGTGAELPPAINARILEYGTMGIRMGEFKHDFYATQDMYYDHDVYDQDNYDEQGRYVLLHKKGDIQYHKGDLVYRKGDTYRMMPNEDVMVKAKALVNAFRPYLGVGYNTTLTKDKKTKLAVDAGIMMWGGSPKIVTHDGVDIAHDLVNVNGQVGDVLRVMRRFPIYPVLEVRVARSVF